MEDQIIALLQKKKLIDSKTASTVKELIARGKTIEQTLVGGKYVSDQDFAKAKAEALGLPYICLLYTSPSPRD